ncbi:hypothetical protein Bbelb_196550 [Branchiostoma belcheri]|nr:hypothetical protein Bbelb_196550 [Branchiostoma belcheri]
MKSAAVVLPFTALCLCVGVWTTGLFNACYREVVDERLPAPKQNWTVKRRQEPGLQRDDLRVWARPRHNYSHVSKVFYNRLPKCGSRAMKVLIAQLEERNHFKFFTDKNLHAKALSGEHLLRFAQMIDKLPLPSIYEKHTYFIDFPLLDAKQPIYINLVRDPIERRVSAYYFLRYGRYGNDFSPILKLRRTEEQRNQTFDYCVVNNLHECSATEPNSFILTQYFCGQSTICSVHRTSRDQPRDGRNSGTPNTRTVSPTSSSQTSRDNGRNTDDVQTPRSDEGYRATNRLPPDPRNRRPALFAQGPEAAWPTPREAADRRHPARRPHPPMGPAHEAVWPTPREAADMRHPVSRQHPPSGPAIPLRPFSPYVPDYEHFYSNWYPETWGVPRPWFSPEFPQRRPSQAAVEVAKENIRRHYAVVGVLEEFSSFLKVLEGVMPQFFRGALTEWKQIESSQVPYQKTNNKIPPSKKTQQILRQRLSLDYQVYDFILERFHIQKKQLGIKD